MPRRTRVKPCGLKPFGFKLKPCRFKPFGPSLSKPTHPPFGLSLSKPAYPPFGLSLSKPCAPLRQAQPERLVSAQPGLEPATHRERGAASAEVPLLPVRIKTASSSWLDRQATPQCSAFSRGRSLAGSSRTRSMFFLPADYSPAAPLSMRENANSMDNCKRQ